MKIISFIENDNLRGQYIDHANTDFSPQIFDMHSYKSFGIINAEEKNYFSEVGYNLVALYVTQYEVVLFVKLESFCSKSIREN